MNRGRVLLQREFRALQGLQEDDALPLRSSLMLLLLLKFCQFSGILENQMERNMEKWT